MGSIIYQHTTLAAAESALGIRLSETAQSANVRFARAEIDYYIYEAVRTWNSLTNVYQGNGAFVVPAGNAFIDLSTAFPALRPRRITDQYLVGLIQYHLFEPYSPTVWTGTEMFTLSVITQALQRRLNQFLLETGIVVNRHVTPAAPATITPTDHYELDSTILDVRRIAWIRARNGKVSPLWPSSNFAIRTESYAGHDEEIPRTYAFNERAPGVIQFGPPSIDDGSLDICSVDSGATLNPAVGVAMGVPDDFVYWIKWGALSDLLSADGPARDYARAALCEKLYQIGVQAAKSAISIVDATIGGIPAQFSSVAALDMSDPSWQSIPGTPRVLAAAALDLFALDRPPLTDTPLHISTVRSHPVVATTDISGAGTQYLQVSADQLDLILGYAESLAMFKIGGREFQSTQHLSDAFFAAAHQYNERIDATSVFESDMRDLSREQDYVKPSGVVVEQAKK